MAWAKGSLSARANGNEKYQIHLCELSRQLIDAAFLNFENNWVDLKTLFKLDYIWNEKTDKLVFVPLSGSTIHGHVSSLPVSFDQTILLWKHFAAKIIYDKYFLFWF